MAYFNDSISNIKLCVLYMLKQLDTSVTKHLLSVSLMEAVNLPYFDILLAISELESQGNIASVHFAYGTCYGITPKGLETLSDVEKNIPKSIRTSCDEYVKTKRSDFMKMEQLSAYSRENESGGYDAVLSSIDKDGVVLTIVISVVDKKICETMCKNWEQRSHKVYNGIIDQLINE